MLDGGFQVLAVLGFEPPSTQTIHRLNQSQGGHRIDTMILKHPLHQSTPLTVSISTRHKHPLTPPVTISSSPIHHTILNLNLTHQSTPLTPHSHNFIRHQSSHLKRSHSHASINTPHTTQSHAFFIFIHHTIHALIHSHQSTLLAPHSHKHNSLPMVARATNEVSEHTPQMLSI